MGKFKQLETVNPFPDAGLTEEQAEEIIDYYCRRRW